MRIITFALLVVFAISAVAQKTPVEKAINKYAKKGIDIHLIEPGTKEFEEEFKVDEKTMESLSKLDAVMIIRPDSINPSKAAEEKLVLKTREALDDERYVGLLEVHGDDGEDVSMHVSYTDKGVITEAILLVDESDDFVMIYVQGVIDFSNFDFEEMIEALASGKKKDSEHEESGGE